MLSRGEPWRESGAPKPEGWSSYGPQTAMGSCSVGASSTVGSCVHVALMLLKPGYDAPTQTDFQGLALPGQAHRDQMRPRG
jgi:hypothetical protein